mmetsp:Transcript_15300/g.41911  ORF Transcript_15300/g.41911 Transcript_15300/m.41911 type:complete len:217 (-) Transcript_15300:146-796(-)
MFHAETALQGASQVLQFFKDASLQDEHLLHHELAHVNNIFHSDTVGTTKLQDQVEKIIEGQLPVPLEYEIRQFNETHDVDPHLLHGASNFRSNQQPFKFLLRELLVAVSHHVGTPHDGLERIPYKTCGKVFLLHGGDHTHHLHEHADQHVECNEGGHENINEDQYAEKGVLIRHVVDHGRHVWQNPIQKQREHRLRNALEVLLPRLRAVGQDSETE